MQERITHVVVDVENTTDTDPPLPLGEYLDTVEGLVRYIDYLGSTKTAPEDRVVIVAVTGEMVTVKLTPAEAEAVLAYLDPIIKRAKLTAAAPLFRAHHKLDTALVRLEENHNGQV